MADRINYFYLQLNHENRETLYFNPKKRPDRFNDL